jgi:hypothetical protein
MFYMPNNTTAKELETTFVEGFEIRVWECLPCVIDNCPSKKSRFFMTIESIVPNAKFAEEMSSVLNRIEWTFCRQKAELKAEILKIQSIFDTYNKWLPKASNFPHRIKECKEKLSKYGINI